jgi:hypothetical protein
LHDFHLFLRFLRLFQEFAKASHFSFGFRVSGLGFRVSAANVPQMQGFSNWKLYLKISGESLC